jgi:hypothetical protein
MLPLAAPDSDVDDEHFARYYGFVPLCNQMNAVSMPLSRFLEAAAHSAVDERDAAPSPPERPNEPAARDDERAHRAAQLAAAAAAAAKQVDEHYSALGLADLAQLEVDGSRMYAASLGPAPDPSGVCVTRGNVLTRGMRVTWLMFDVACVTRGLQELCPVDRDRVRVVACM